MEFLVCPICKQPIEISFNTSVCHAGHQFPVIDGILDLIPDISDRDLIEEEHWNDVAKKRKMKFSSDRYIKAKIDEDCRITFEKSLMSAYTV